MDGVMTGTLVVEDAPGVTMTEMSPRTPLMAAVPVVAPEEAVMAVAASLTTTADLGLPANLRMALALDEADVMVPSGVAVADEAAVVVEEVGVEAAAAVIASPPPRTRSMPSSIPTCWAIPRRPR
jgi:hypothetical protein